MTAKRQNTEKLPDMWGFILKVQSNLNVHSPKNKAGFYTIVLRNLGSATVWLGWANGMEAPGADAPRASAKGDPVTRLKLSMGHIRGPGPLAYTRAMSEHRCFPKRLNRGLLVQCISNDMTEIYLIRVSVTQPSTAASMEHRVAICVFSIF